jgi:hypothetical protein
MFGAAFRRQIATLLLCGLCAGRAAAQEDGAKQAAKAHFDAGNTLLAKGEVAAALVEFQRSRALFPTRGNTLNAAIALQRLGRFDEALELYSSLPRDFELDREQRARVDREVELLRALTGKLSIRAEAGVSVSIDGRDRGTAPFAQPLIVLGGSHLVRARQAGRAPVERRVEIVTDSEQELVIEPLAAEAAPAAEQKDAPPPPPLPAPTHPPVAGVAPSTQPVAPTTEARSKFVVALDFGPALGLGFGGPLADSCSGACSAALPLGFSPRVRAGYQPGAHGELGFELGYLRLSGSYDDRPDTLEPRGSGKQPGLSRDELAWSGWSLGGYAAWSGRGRWHGRASLGLGVSFARVRDERSGEFDVDPQIGGRYRASASVVQSARSKALYIAPELGIGWNVTPSIELALGVTLTSSIVLGAPRFTREGVVVTNAMDQPELAYLSETDLTGSAFFALLPRLGVSARF